MGCSLPREKQPFAIVIRVRGENTPSQIGTVFSVRGLRLDIDASGHVGRLRLCAPGVTPADGPVTLDIPAYRGPCNISLFGKLALPNHSDPYTAKTLGISASGKTVRQLSLKKLNGLPLDADGYRILKLPAVK